MKKFKWLVPTIYIIFLMLPIYWLLNMSFKTTTEIINTYTLWPQEFTLDNYKKIFTDSTWYTGYPLEYFNHLPFRSSLFAIKNPPALLS